MKRYQKLYSLNPKQWRTMTYLTLIFKYCDYLKFYALTGGNLDTAKTFKEWRQTEI